MEKEEERHQHKEKFLEILMDMSSE